VRNTACTILAADASAYHFYRNAGRLVVKTLDFAQKAGIKIVCFYKLTSKYEKTVDKQG